MPHQRTFPRSASATALNRKVPSAAGALWGGVLLAGVSTLFWVPTIALICGALGAPASVEFWMAFAAVMFGLGVSMWALLQSGTREVAAGSMESAGKVEILRLNERRRGKTRTAEA